MRCELCGRGMAHGVTLIRQNEKGVAGIWRCERGCNRVVMDQGVAHLVAVIQQANPVDCCAQADCQHRGTCSHTPCRTLEN